MAQKIIVDGDFGGDEMQLLAVLLGQPEKFSILAATAVFGNTSHEQVLKNAGSILRLLNADKKIPRYAGSKFPSGADMPEGDGAHGEDGVGGVVLPLSDVPPASGHAIDFILGELEKNPPGTITITATGPLTNIALAYQKNPEVMRRVKEIIIMGGCTAEIPAYDMPLRQGNITPFAEFNFYMAPLDAAIVLESGLPIILFPMNCTQQLAFTPEREEKLRALLFSEPEKCDQLIAMMKAAEWLDKLKFNSYNFMHDIHTALFITDRTQYTGRRGYIVVEANEKMSNKGHSNFSPVENGNIFVLEKVLDADRLYDIFLHNLENTMLQN